MTLRRCSSLTLKLPMCRWFLPASSISSANRPVTPTLSRWGPTSRAKPRCGCRFATIVRWLLRRYGISTVTARSTCVWRATNWWPRAAAPRSRAPWPRNRPLMPRRRPAVASIARLTTAPLRSTFGCASPKSPGMNCSAMESVGIR